MDTLLKPEVIIPIVLNLILAATTIGYLVETRAMRKGALHQVELARRQHFVTTAPFLYASSLELKDGTEDLRLKITNPSEKLARDAKYIFYDSAKKTFRAPDKSYVVVKPGEDATVLLPPEPFTKSEVESKLKLFYEIEHLDKTLIGEGPKSYLLLFYTDVEGSVYSVRANFVSNDEGKLSRGRSRFKKVYDPRG